MRKTNNPVNSNSISNRQSNGRNTSKCGRRDLNPSHKLGKLDLTGEKQLILHDDVKKYLMLRDLENLSNSWYSQCKQWLKHYLQFVDWKVDETRTLEYCKYLKDRHPLTYYRKKIYQIRRFLEYLKVTWATTIKLPPEPEYYPKRITRQSIEDALTNFKDHRYFKQIKATILLGMTSGIRPEEMYQLSPEDIEVEKRIVHIFHDPENGQTTKTKRSRISFFNIEAQQALSDYLKYFYEGNDLKCLFNQSHIIRIFKYSKVKVKDLRKFFSQEWDRRSGPTSIKKILMGHSLKGDVDLMHYNCQSEDDLKRIYDKVMNTS